MNEIKIENKWLYLDDQPFPTDRPMVGVEVPTTSPAYDLLDACLDLQHDGGVVGFPSLPAECIAACDSAAWIITNADVYTYIPDDTVFVTAQLDPDSLVAAMILSGRVPVDLLQDPDVRGRLRLLAQMSVSIPKDGGWVPEMRPQVVSDCPVWGPVAALCVAAQRSGGGWPEAAALATLSGQCPPPELVAASERHAQEWAAVRELCPQFDVVGPVAFGLGLPHVASAWAAGLSRAPMVVTATVVDGKREYTVGVSRDCGEAGLEAIGDFLQLITELESGWNGAATICVSPFYGTTLEVGDVVSTAVKAARGAGLHWLAAKGTMA